MPRPPVGRSAGEHGPIVARLSGRVVVAVTGRVGQHGH